MASANVTVTAPVGPGNTVSSQLFSNVREVRFDVDKEIVELKLEDGTYRQFDYETVATVTYTISGEVATVAIST